MNEIVPTPDHRYAATSLRSSVSHARNVVVNKRSELVCAAANNHWDIVRVKKCRS